MPLYLRRRNGRNHDVGAGHPGFDGRSVEDGLGQAKALVAGGLYAIEVTLRTPSALAAIEDRRKVPGAIVGAGTIVSVEQIAGDQGRSAVPGQPGRTAALAKAAADCPFRSCRVARRPRKPWRCGSSASAR